MKNFLLTTTGLLFSFFALFAQENKVSATKVWESPDQLFTCESVLYDIPSHIIYVSCINGNPTDKDGSGFISVLTENGELMIYKWVEGLNAPKGMGIYEGKLYVSDIDQVVRINIASAKIEKYFPVEGAKFLNDIVIDKQGDVYISDMATGIIHRIHDDGIGPWIEDSSFAGANGLNIENGELLIGTKIGIMSARLEDKRLWKLVSNDGGIDGLEPDGKGNYIISDWVGKIQRVSPDGAPILIMDTSKEGINAADIHFIPEKNLLLVPTFGWNRVVAYELEFTE